MPRVPQRRLIVAVLVLVTVAAAGVTPQRTGTNDASVASAQVAAVAAFRHQLEGLFAQREAGAWSVLAVSLGGGDTLVARTPHHPLAPASNLKLLTAGAALEYLGPDYRFLTLLLADGPIRGGVLEGNLYLYGTGDPTLGVRFSPAPAPQLRALADSLAALGIRRIRGDVIGDGTYFSGSGSGEGWRRDYVNAWYAAPAGALSVHENLVRVRVSPGAPGGPPELEFSPGGSGIAVRNEAVTGGPGPLRVIREDHQGPVVVRGGVRGTSWHAVPVTDAATYAAAVFRDVLLDRGIILQGRVWSTDAGAPSPLASRRVFAPALQDEMRNLRVLATHASRPLREMLEVIQHQSHNFYSEQVFRALGRASGGDGSPASAEHAVKVLLARAGADTTRVRVVDGCGLSPLNRVSAGDMVAFLSYMLGSAHAEAFTGTIPVAGEARRFRRMGGTPAAGNLRAKTGTIDHVSALSGYVASAEGELIVFSIIGNDLPSVARGKHIENLIGARLAAFQRRGVPGGGLDGADTKRQAAPAGP